MAGLLAKWFAPEITRLEQRVEDLTEEKEAWKALYVGEIKTNRTREDLLVNAALGAAGASPVLTREALSDDPSKEEPAAGDYAPDEFDEKVLRSRALEIAQQTYDVEEPTEDQVENTYRDMLKNPGYWLRD